MMIRGVLFFLLIGAVSGESWSSFKAMTISEMHKVPGWCSEEKAQLMMDLIKENQCTLCVEIGVFSGRSLLPIAKALQYLGKGSLFAIDAWDSKEAVRGFNPGEPSYTWWKELNFTQLHRQSKALIKKKGLSACCTLIQARSVDSAELFEEGSIDFLHLDGNHGEEGAFEDLCSYFPKVREGGFILLNDPNWHSLKRSLVFLLENSELRSTFSPTASFFLFQKSCKREESARRLYR